jgi:N-acetylmuramoyl-L-alanine amidase
LKPTEVFTSDTYSNPESQFLPSSPLTKTSQGEVMSMRNWTRVFAGAFVATCVALCSQASAYKICIDPGHGGSDPGAVGGGLEEADVVLDMGLKFKNWMNKDTQDTGGGGSWTVYMTRTTDSTVSLSGRTSYANNNSVNRFMSIHANAFSSSSANGIETFCYGSGSSYSFDLRNKVYEEATAMWPLTKRGKKTASFYVVKYTNMPAELHETAFITNWTDRTYLSSSTHRDNHARSELYAIQRHMGYGKYTPQDAVYVTDNSSSKFTPGSGWWTSTSTPGYYGSNYHVRATASTSAASTFNFTLGSSGTYKVEAWWTAGGNRSATAPYIVYHSGGSTVVSKNQQANGGKWNNLGNFSFGSGNRQVKLSCWTTTGYYVVADAVRLTKQ